MWKPRSITWSEILHYDDVIMSTIASQITSLTIVYSTIYSGADQSKHQSSASLAFVWGIHRGPVNSPHKWPVTRKMFPFDDVIMFPYYWTFMRRKHRQPVGSHNRGPVMQSYDISFVWTKCWTTSRIAGNLGRHAAHVTSLGWLIPRCIIISGESACIMDWRLLSSPL